MAHTTKSDAVNQLFDVAYAVVPFSKGVLHSAWRTLSSPSKIEVKRAKLECLYCCEHKREYKFVARAAIPYQCHMHFSGSNRVCKACMDASLRAQFECKPLIEVGCPQCGESWEPERVKNLVRLKTQRRFKELDKLARARILIPPDLPDGATVELLLSEATRFCPGCRWPFVKIGGCDSMICSKCNKLFDINYALILEDGSGRRAADLVQSKPQQPARV